MLRKYKNTTLGRVLGLMGPRLLPNLLCVIVFSADISFCFNIVLAYLIRDVMNATALSDRTLLLRALILALVTFFGGTPILILTSSLSVGYIQRTMTEVRVQLFRKITSLPVVRFETGQNGSQAHSGDLLSRATNDLDRIESVYFSQLENVFVAIVGGLLALVPMFLLEWRLALISLAVGILQLITNVSLAKRTSRAGETLQGKIGSLTERLSDLLQSLAVSKMFNLEEKVHQTYRQEVNQVASATYRLNWYEGIANVLGGLYYNASTVGLIVTGAFLAMHGLVDLGTVASFLFFTSWTGFAFGNIGWFITDVQRSLAAARRVFEILDTPDEPARYPGLAASAARYDTPNLAVEMRNLSFQYKTQAGGEKFQGGVQGINMSVRRGQIAALVGPSGGGKSTIVKLLMGLYPPDSGELWIDGRNLNSYSISDLRDRVAYVPQDAYLFDGTIEENIAYGKPGSTREEVMAAAKAANAHAFILEQPQGYDTPVGERGAKLSGGQRQRIAIARALLKNAPILLLDEATSALDSESEQEVQTSLEILMRGRTTITIAHRLSTIQKADCIYVLDQGMITEKGSHKELVDTQGLYARFVKSSGQ